MIVSDICNTLADVNSYLRRIFDVSLDVYPAPISRDFWESGTGLAVLYKSQPIPGTAGCLQELTQKLGGPAYVTCRPARAEFITRRWLKMHGFPEGPVICCRNAQEKLTAARKLGAVMALEDDPEAVRLYARAGITVLYPDWPYNKSINEPNTFRVARDGRRLEVNHLLPQ